jgi:hypothetical protein
MIYLRASFLKALSLQIINLWYCEKMTDIKRIGSAGVHTVEGNVAGSRAARLFLDCLLYVLIYAYMFTKSNED